MGNRLNGLLFELFLSNPRLKSWAAENKTLRMKPFYPKDPYGTVFLHSRSNHRKSE
jgi:hypothetical protein